ncbi:tryptophan synthase subunit beta [Spirochaeta africana]|uniref:Tryptophan synthase beta chain n=1 Tax=Spirochaeta africana (strain ATCC 700263 / DSM 8902 / Z-7692) TaxID=889378 RepID=H9UM35_SPIAZ|nr:tryptophan synthase subunit beta [Spirochaeta africana]AFG38578.1 tryptophan synthase, beta subunit [Spirochaeta africana DSM 8902]
MKLHKVFGEYGGAYVAEVLRPALIELEREFLVCADSEEFQAEYQRLLQDYVGRPTPLLFAENTTRELGGAQIYIKLEGLANTGAHKINNALGQALVAKHMGKRRIIAETGAGQHGLATAAVCAKLGLDCTIYMGEVDIARQRPNVYCMELYGATVVPVVSGSRTLKDAVNEALRDWAGSFQDTHYLLGSALGPAPFPDIVREFQSVIGREIQSQAAARNLHPDVLVACVGGGSNAIGMFAPFLDDAGVRLIGVEAGGSGPGIGENAARMHGTGSVGIVQGYKSLFLLDDDGQVQHTHSISAGLDYAGIGPQLAHLGAVGRVEFLQASDAEALVALQQLARNEGVIFALESAHGAAAALKLAPQLPSDTVMVINMSGRGDKDLFITAKELDPRRWREFLLSEASHISREEDIDE